MAQEGGEELAAVLPLPVNLLDLRKDSLGLEKLPTGTPTPTLTL